MKNEERFEQVFVCHSTGSIVAAMDHETHNINNYVLLLNNQDVTHSDISEEGYM